MVQLFADPFNLQGNNQNLQGSSGVNLQPAGNPYGPTLPPVAPKPTPVAVSAPKPSSVSSPRSAAPSVNFYKPDPNSQQVYDANGTPLSYQQYIAAGGRPDFSNVLNQTVPVKQTQSYPPASSQIPAADLAAFKNANPGLEFTDEDLAYYNAASANPNNQLARSAAAAGLSVDDYLKIVTGKVSSDERNKIYSDLGITDLENQIFTPPSKNTQQLFTDAYAQAGLSDLKAQIQSKIAEITKARNNFTDASGQVNENPFLSEASRVGRVSRLNDKAEARIGNLNNELSQLTDLYNNGVNEVGSLITRSTADFQQNQTLNTQKLQYLLQKAEQQVSDLQSSKTSEAYKYLPDYLTAKAKAQKPDTIGSAESGYYRWNPDSGIFEQVIAPNVTPNFQANPLTGELFNTKTGQGQGGGSNYGAGLQFNTGSNDMRTDRHNNPTAFTTDIAKQAGLKEGVDYVTGDPFPNNPNFKTAKLLGDPIATTIKVIDNIGFYTQSGQPRWTYINSIPDAKNWSNLNYEQKARVVAQMYQKEGGNGSLVQGSVTNSTIDNLVQQVLQNPRLLDSLPQQQKTAVIARLAQNGQQVPNQPLSGDAAKLSGVVQTLPNEIEQLKAAFRSDYKGALRGVVLGTNRELVKLVDQVADKVGRLRSGGAINKEEEARFKRQIATFMDIPFGNVDNAITALDGVLAEANQVSKSLGLSQMGGLQMPSGSSNVNISDLNFSF